MKYSIRVTNDGGNIHHLGRTYSHMDKFKQMSCNDTKVILHKHFQQNVLQSQN